MTVVANYVCSEVGHILTLDQAGAWLPAPATWWRVGLKHKRVPLTWAAVLSYLLVALRHQANPARWPKRARLLPFACTEDVRAHSLRPLQAAHSSSIFAEVIRLFHSFLPCKGHRKQVGAYNAVFDDSFSTLMNGCSALAT